MELGMGRGLGRALVVAALSGSLSACSTTATIYREHGPPLEARIVGGSSDAVFVEGSDGRDFPVPRHDIHDIDHPGNVHELVGGLILAYGLANILVGYSQCNSNDNRYPAAYCIGVFTPALIGAGMLTWGLFTHSESVDAAHDRSRRDAFPPPPLRRLRRDAPAQRVNLPEAPTEGSTPAPGKAPPAVVPTAPSSAPPAAPSPYEVPPPSPAAPSPYEVPPPS